MSVTWNAPFSGGAGISDYDVQYRTSGMMDWTNWPHSGTATDTIITGLTYGMSYDVQVRATNSEGDSPWSGFSTGTPVQVLGISSAYTDDIRGNGFRARWGIPTAGQGQGIDNVLIQVRAGTSGTWSQITLGSSSRSRVSEYATGYGTYQWRVAVRDDSYTGEYSPVQTVTLANQLVFNPANSDAIEIVGNRVYILNDLNAGDSIIAYTLTGERMSGEDIGITSLIGWRDICSDGTTMWVAGTNAIRAYTISTGARNTSLEPSGIGVGIATNGSTLWVNIGSGNEIEAYSIGATLTRNTSADFIHPSGVIAMSYRSGSVMVGIGSSYHVTAFSTSTGAVIAGSSFNTESTGTREGIAVSGNDLWMVSGSKDRAFKFYTR